MSSGAARRLRVWLAALALVAALGIALLRVTTLSEMGSVRLAANWALIDFRNTIYYPVRAFTDGANPYNRAEYRARYPEAETFPPFLPSTLLIHSPFGALPRALAEMAYVGFSVCLVVLLGRAAVRANGVTSWTAALVAAALVTLSRPGQWNLLLGQVTLQAVLLNWVALRFAQRSPWLSGLALGAAAFKPTFALPIGLLMLARGDVKAVRAGVVAGLALNLPVAAILEHRAGGIQFLLRNPAAPYHSWTGSSDSVPGASLYRIDLVALVGRIVGRPLSHGAELVITILVLVVAALFLLRMRGTERTPGHQSLSEAIICTATLLCVHHLDYDLLLLVFPVAALVYRRAPGLLENVAVRRATLCLFALMAANYVSTQAVLDRLAPDVAVWLGLASVNSLALLLIFAVYALTVLRWPSVRLMRARGSAGQAGDAWESPQSEPVGGARRSG